MDSDDPSTAKKLQKAGREKLRRDRLNEQFIELGNTLDGDRPKNDKATMLTDTIQLLTDLTVEVNKLKAEHAALSEEFHELAQEKNDLREEKGGLKTEIERLDAQCRQRQGSTFSWVAMDHSVLPHPPSYPYSLPIPFPSGPIPMHHPSMQPYPFYGTPHTGIFPNPGSAYIPYMTPTTAPAAQRSSRLVSDSQGLKSLSEQEGEKQNDRNNDPNVAETDVELKTLGSTVDEVVHASSGEKKSRKSLKKKSIAAESSHSSRCSSSPGVRECTSSSIVGSGKADD